MEAAEARNGSGGVALREQRGGGGLRVHSLTLIGVSDPVGETEQWHGAMLIGWVLRKRIQMSRGSYKIVQGRRVAMIQIWTITRRNSGRVV